MSAPTAQHERRAQFIDDLASLIGCTMEARLDDAYRPDVVRIDPRRGRLLIGEAKHWEAPGSIATGRRLNRYGALAAHWSKIGFGVLFLVCHDRHWESERWLQVLASVVGSHGTMRPIAAGSASFDAETTIAWLECVPRKRAVPMTPRPPA